MYLLKGEPRVRSIKLAIGIALVSVGLGAAVMVNRPTRASASRAPEVAAMNDASLRCFEDRRNVKVADGLSIDDEEFTTLRACLRVGGQSLLADHIEEAMRSGVAEGGLARCVRASGFVVTSDNPIVAAVDIDKSQRLAFGKKWISCGHISDDMGAAQLIRLMVSATEKDAQSQRELDATVAK
jgi:hypothetical protein